MLFITSILLLLVICLLLHRQIKKHANVFYLITALITIGFITLHQMEMYNYIPENLYKYSVSIFTRGAISTALFTIVMYTGVLDKNLPLSRLFLSIRAELSIMACILTLGHNILYGINIFPEFFTNPGEMPVPKLLATILTIILLCIMLPLMITSFPGVRRKMNFKKWKKLQRLSYLFYGLIYAHIMLLFIPKIQKGKLSDVIIYSTIFLSYYVLRLYRYSKDKKRKTNSKKSLAI